MHPSDLPPSYPLTLPPPFPLLLSSPTDAYGFRWRLYDGPPIDWAAIEDQQMSLEEIRELQVTPLPLLL